MPAQTASSSTDDVAQLDRLGTQLETLGFAAAVCTRAGQSRLTWRYVIRVPVSSASASTCRTALFTGAGAERISGTEDVTKAAATLANVLRTVSGE